MSNRTESERRDVMLHTVEELSKLVEAGLPGRTTVAFAFLQARHGHDDHEPSTARLEAAVEAFAALTPDERKAICNGWNAEAATDRPTRAELIREMEEVGECEAVVQKLHVSQHFAHTRFDLDASVKPVEVLIRFGTAKADALAAIREIEAMILDHFNDMIAAGPEGMSLNELERIAVRRIDEDRQRFSGKLAS
jgi:hypothetical protein